MNTKGGIDPTNLKDLQKAKEADLITLPKNVEGANCFNCRFIKIMDDKNLGYCLNPKVSQLVTYRMCCSFWDNQDVNRPWKK